MNFKLVSLSILLSVCPLFAQDVAEVDLRGLTPLMMELKTQDIIRKMIQEESQEALELIRRNPEKSGLSLTRGRSSLIFKSANDCSSGSSSTLISMAAAARVYPGQDDKKKHAVGGGIISEVTRCSTGRADYGVLASCGVGIAKEELFDRFQPKSHTRDMKDAAITCLGGLGVLQKSFELPF